MQDDANRQNSGRHWMKDGGNVNGSAVILADRACNDDTPSGAGAILSPLLNTMAAMAVKALRLAAAY